MKTLFPPQAEANKHILSVLQERGAALNSSDTGVGKTVMSIETARDLGLPPLVVSPKSAIPSWKSTFAEQGVDYLDVINYEALRNSSTFYGHWEGKPREEGIFHFHDSVEFIVWDEVHMCKGRTSQNGRILSLARGEGRKNLMLSATAAEDPSEMKNLGFVLGLHKYTNFLIWARALGCSFDGFGKLQFSRDSMRADEHLTTLREMIYPHCGARLTRADMGEFFSETCINTDPVDFGDDGKIAELYAEVEDFMEEIAEKELTDSDHPEAQALIRTLRARQKVEMLKLPLMRDMVVDAMEQGLHVAVFLNFNDSIIALNDMLGGKCPVVWGTDPRNNRQQSPGEREANIQRFQSNEEHVILLNIAAGGQSINLHDTVGNSPRLALIAPSWNAKQLHQCLGRVDRAGALTDTLQRILFAADTIEEDVKDALERKLRNLRTLHDVDAMPRVPVKPPSRKTAKKKSATKKTAAKKTPAKKTPAKKSAAKKTPAKKTPAKKKEEPPVIDVEAEVVEEGVEEHAEYNPSSLRYFEVCPSYKNREEDEDEDVHEVTAAGSRLHDALEKEDFDGLFSEEEQLLGQQTLEAAESIEEMHGVQDGELHREIRLPIHLTQFDTFGTCDRLRIVGEVAIAQDYKFGYTPVDDAEVNCQAWAYSLGIFQKFPEVQVIYFYFLIPRQDEISAAIFLRDGTDYELGEDEEPAASEADIHLRINLIIDRAKKLAGKEFSPQPHNCEFCGNKLGCEALAAKVLPIAHSRPEDGLELPDELDPEMIEDPEEIAKLRMLCIPLEGWIKAVKSQANFLAFDEGYDIPGFKKMWRKSKRTIGDAHAAFNIAHERGVTLDEFLACAGSIKITDLETAVASHANHGEKQKAKDLFTEDLREAEVLSGGDEDSEYGVLQIDRKQNK